MESTIVDLMLRPMDLDHRGDPKEGIVKIVVEQKTGLTGVKICKIVVTENPTEETLDLDSELDRLRRFRLEVFYQ